jgi:hypothetical protein
MVPLREAPPFKALSFLHLQKIFLSAWHYAADWRGIPFRKASACGLREGQNYLARNMGHVSQLMSNEVDAAEGLAARWLPEGERGNVADR